LRNASARGVPPGSVDLRDFGCENWLDQRHKAAAYADRDPVVLIIGAGQAGLLYRGATGCAWRGHLDRRSQCAHRRQLAQSLSLAHPNQTKCFVNDLPYLPFPPSWPIYISKDKLANWLEFYADAMELNCWMDTEFISGEYDEKAERWTVKLRRADRATHCMSPRHLVLAVGASPISRIPNLAWTQVPLRERLCIPKAIPPVPPGRGRKALVLGSGTSVHDVAQDLAACGAQVTLIQRGPLMW